MRFLGLLNGRWNKLVVGLLAISIILVAWLNCYYNHNHAPGTSLWEGANSIERVAVLQTKIRFLEMESQKQQDRINNLEDVLSGKVNETELVTSEEGNPYYEEIMTRLKRKSGLFNFVKPEVEPEAFQASLTYNTMPHLMRNPKSRCPAFQILSPRKSSEVDVVIGIPTVKRDRESYLADTLRSLIDGMTAAEQQSNLIVVYIGEADDISYVVDTAYEINVLFPRHFGQLIEVISPTRYWYPEWENLQPTLGDSQKRTRWRTKQNLDAIFLMSYVQNKGSYYLMMEDDVLAKNGYMADMKEFIAQQPKRDQWFFINFSTIGGIGKLMKMEDVMFFSSYVQIFYQYMPIDWLIELFLADRICGLENNDKIIDMISHDEDPDVNTIVAFTKDDEKQCEKLKGNIRPTYKTSLFEHAGLYSSLRGKIQKVKPSLRKGKDTIKFFPHKNPPLESILSTIESDNEHTIERAYNGEDFFWGIKPKLNDTIEFWFGQPVNLERFFFRTGNIIQQRDIIRKGVVEVLPEGQTAFVHIDDFDEFGNAESNIASSIGPLSAIRIKILEDSSNWVIISEIELLPLETT